MTLTDARPSRRSFLAGAGGLATATALSSLLNAGCRSKLPDRDAAGRTIVNFYSYAGEGFYDFYTKWVVPEFERTHPHIRVRLNTNLGSANYDSKLLTLVAGGLAPDIFHVTQQNFPFYAAKGVALPLEELIADDRSFNVADYFPRVLDGMRHEGRLVGLPSDFSSVVMVYNVDLFDALRIERPADNWTWADYLDVCRRVTRRPDVYGTTNPAAYNRWPAWVWMSGGSIFTPDMSRCTMDTAEAIAGLKFYADLSLEHRVAAAPGLNLGLNESEQFIAQRIGVYAGARYVYKKYVLQKPLKFRWDLAPMPRGPAGLATTFLWGGNCILRSTKHPQAAWEFLKFMSDARGGRLSMLAGNAIAPHRPTAEALVGDPRTPNLPPNDRAFLDAIEYGQQAPFPSGFAEYNTAMTGISDAFLGLTPIDEACRVFTKDVNRLLERQRLHGRGT